MSTLSLRSILTMLLVIGSLAACSFGPPESCGETIGGTADTALFDQYFSRMALVTQDGMEGEPGDNGVEFASGDQLELRADVLTDVTVRLCIQGMTSGSIAFDQTQSFVAGASGMGVGSFEPGIYVMRVIVEDTLVKNFPFSIK